MRLYPPTGAADPSRRLPPAAQPLPVYWQIPQFQLTAQSGQPFDSKSLEGSIWVANFIYTTCPGPCPRMSAQMRGVQTAIAIHART